jgi:hypothetical protein
LLPLDHVELRDEEVALRDVLLRTDAFHLRCDGDFDGWRKRRRTKRRRRGRSGSRRPMTRERFGKTSDPERKVNISFSLGFVHPMPMIAQKSGDVRAFQFRVLPHERLSLVVSKDILFGDMRRRN